MAERIEALADVEAPIRMSEAAQLLGLTRQGLQYHLQTGTLTRHPASRANEVLITAESVARLWSRRRLRASAAVGKLVVLGGRLYCLESPALRSGQGVIAACEHLWPHRHCECGEPMGMGWDECRDCYLRRHFGRCGCGEVRAWDDGPCDECAAAGMRRLHRVVGERVAVEAHNAPLKERSAAPPWWRDGEPSPVDVRPLPVR